MSKWKEIEFQRKMNKEKDKRGRDVKKKRR